MKSDILIKNSSSSKIIRIKTFQRSYRPSQPDPTLWTLPPLDPSLRDLVRPNLDAIRMRKGGLQVRISRGFTIGVSRTVSPRFFFFFNETEEDEKKGKKTEKRKKIGNRKETAKRGKNGNGKTEEDGKQTEQNGQKLRKKESEATPFRRPPLNLRISESGTHQVNLGSWFWSGGRGSEGVGLGG